jgi:putative DNA primase/helicase
MQTAVDPADAPDCETFRKFLLEIMDKDAEKVAFLQRFWGYALTGDASEEALIFGYGTGANGKGVSVNTIAKVMGGYAISATMDTFTVSKTERHPTELARLRGKRLVTASETEEGKSWDESRIKRLTGRDPVPARFMRKDFFEFLPAFKLFIVGNHKPKLRTIDEAIRRRFLLVPFAVTIPEDQRDRHFADKLRPEWPGILRWLIEGCLEWQRIGLQPPASVIETTQSYFDTQDLLGQWLDERCVCRPDDHTLHATVKVLYASWKEFADARGEYAGGSKQFSDALENRGFTRRHTTVEGVNARWFFGLELKL